MNIISHIDPFDYRFQEAKEDFEDLHKWQKVAVIAASIFAALITPFLLFTGGIAAFNWTVKYFDNDNFEKSLPVELFQSKVEDPKQDQITTEESSSSDSDDSIEEHSRYNVESLINEFDVLWDDVNKKFHDIPFNLERVTSLLKEHNGRFSSFSTDQNTNYGVIYKQDIPENSKVFVRADLHGDLKSLLENLKELQNQGLLDAHFRCKQNVQLVFLGDYMDRGPQGMEIVQILAHLRLENPNQIHLLRGNHEYLTTNTFYGGSDHHLQDMLGDDEAKQALSNFYNTLPISVHLGQEGDGSKEYIQFTHALFEAQADTAPILDAPEKFAQMEIPRNLKLSERVKALPYSKTADYPLLIGNEDDKNKKRQLKLAYAAQRVHQLAKMEDRGDRAGFDGNLTAFNWADIAEEHTFISNLGNREWQISPADIKHCLRLQTTKNKTKMVFRGHEHMFRHHCLKRNKVLVSTLPVGMDCQHYARAFPNQLDRAYMLDVKPRVKNWTKQAITRESGSSTSKVSTPVSIRAATL